MGLDITDLWKTENQLRQAKKMDAIGKLAGGIAHDLTTCSPPFNGYSNLILETMNLSEDDDIREIRKAGNWAAGLTR